MYFVLYQISQVHLLMRGCRMQNLLPIRCQVRVHVRYSLNHQQIIGIPDARNRFGIEMYDGNFIFYANGVQTILLSLGYIGALLYGLFYIILFRNTNLVSRMCIIILFVMGLLESNYLNPYMMLLTIIPCADYHFTRNRLRV